MPYSTQPDILEAIDEETLIQLTDDAGAGAVDASVVERMISDADSEIDAYCGRRYTVPFVTAPGIIRKLSVDIAIYHLYGRRAAGDVPEARKARYSNAVRLLEHISKGVVSLGGEDPSGSPAAVERPSVASGDRVFSRDNLAGF